MKNAVNVSVMICVVKKISVGAQIATVNAGYFAASPHRRTAVFEQTQAVSTATAS